MTAINLQKLNRQNANFTRSRPATENPIQGAYSVVFSKLPP